MKNLCRKLFLVTTLSSVLVGCTTTTTQDGPTPEQTKDNKIIASNANIQLGFLYLDKGDVQTAKQKLLTALDLTPQYPAAWYSMAYYLEVTGNTKKAQEYYLKAIDLAPENGDAQNNYGTFLCHTGKPKESIQHFLLATKDSNYLDIGAAYENAGLCAQLIPDLKAAHEYFSKAVTADPTRKRSLIELAEVAYKLGNYNESQATLNRYLQTNASTPETLLLSYRLAKKDNRTKDATKYSIELQQNFPNSPQAKELRK